MSTQNGTEVPPSSSVERYRSAVLRSDEQLDLVTDLTHTRDALDQLRAEHHARLTAAITDYQARYSAARAAGWTAAELRTHFGCDAPAPAVMDRAVRTGWAYRGRPGAG